MKSVSLENLLLERLLRNAWIVLYFSVAVSFEIDRLVLYQLICGLLFYRVVTLRIDND